MISASAFAALLLWLVSTGTSSLDKALDKVAIRDALTTGSMQITQHEQADGLTLRHLASKRGLLLGAATEAVTLAREPDFARLLASEFSLLTPENRLKFNLVHPQRNRYDFDQVDVIVQFAQANGMGVRGHCLIWHEMVPAWIGTSNISTTEAEVIVRDHIRTVMQRYSGRIRDWDVVNEPITDDGKMRVTRWSSLLGDDYVQKAFRWAREADPSARLFLNDFGIETLCPKSNEFLRLVKQLQAERIPLDGIGFQMHLNLGAGLSTDSLQQNLQRFAGLGLEMHITEMDVSLDQTGVTSKTLAQQARMYHDVLNTALQFPQFKAVIFWGASDRHSWKISKNGPPDAPLLFDSGLEPKPACNAVRQVLIGLRTKGKSL